MNNHTSITSTWIESFILKGKIEDNFSFITKNSNYGSNKKSIII